VGSRAARHWPLKADSLASDDSKAVNVLSMDPWKGSVMAALRGNPYIWVTWLTRLLAGDAHCEWAGWFRAHHTYTKCNDFDFSSWKVQHAAMVRERAEALRSEGFNVYVEGQNKFSLRNDTATLGGCPDIVAVDNSGALVVDCKTGQPRDSDLVQVMIYMLALPHAGHPARPSAVRGLVQYRDRAVPVGPERLTPEFRAAFRDLVRRIAADHPAVKVPSLGECNFCDIGAEDCPQRVGEPPELQHEPHNLF